MLQDQKKIEIMLLVVFLNEGGHEYLKSSQNKTKKGVFFLVKNKIIKYLL